MSASAAVRTWHRVISGFFSPQPFGLLGQKQIADLGDREVATDRLIVPRLEVGQAEFRFGVLEATFDGPAGEGNVQQSFQTRFRWSVAQEVFLFARVE